MHAPIIDYKYPTMHHSLVHQHAMGDRLCRTAVTSCIHYNTREGTFYQGRQSTLQRRKNGKRVQQPCLEQCQLSLAQICLPSFQSTILGPVSQLELVIYRSLIICKLEAMLSPPYSCIITCYEQPSSREACRHRRPCALAELVLYWRDRRGRGGLSYSKHWLQHLTQYNLSHYGYRNTALHFFSPSAGRHLGSQSFIGVIRHLYLATKYASSECQQVYALRFEGLLCLISIIFLLQYYAVYGHLTLQFEIKTSKLG